MTILDDRLRGLSGDEGGYIGIPLKEARRRLIGYTTKKNQVIAEIQRMNVDPQGDGIPVSYLKLQTQLASLNKSINETREWYVVGVLESLDTASRRLNWLTIALIVTTGVLAALTIHIFGF